MSRSVAANNYNRPSDISRYHTKSVALERSYDRSENIGKPFDRSENIGKSSFSNRNLKIGDTLSKYEAKNVVPLSVINHAKHQALLEDDNYMLNKLPLKKNPLRLNPGRGSVSDILKAARKEKVTNNDTLTRN